MDNPLSATVVDIVALLAIVLVVVLLQRFRWFVRIPAAALAGWPIIIGTVQLHWHLLFQAAANESERAWVASHDSGPLAVSLLFGWVYALVVALFTEATIAFVRFVWRRRPNKALHATASPRVS